MIKYKDMQGNKNLAGYIDDGKCRTCGNIIACSVLPGHGDPTLCNRCNVHIKNGGKQ